MGTDKPEPWGSGRGDGRGSAEDPERGRRKRDAQQGGIMKAEGA